MTQKELYYKNLRFTKEIYGKINRRVAIDLTVNDLKLAKGHVYAQKKEKSQVKSVV